MKKKLIIIIGSVVLVAGGIAAYMLFSGPSEPEEPPVSTYTPGDFFVTNVKDSYALFKVTVVLEVDKAEDDKEFAAFMAKNNHIIRDTIVFILREQTEEQLRAPDIKQVLGEEITKKVNAALGITNIQTVYFNDYVLQ